MQEPEDVAPVAGVAHLGREHGEHAVADLMPRRAIANVAHEPDVP